MDTNVLSEARKVDAGKADANVAKWVKTVDMNEIYVSVLTLYELKKGVLEVSRKDQTQGSILQQWFDGQVMTAFEGRILLMDTPTAMIAAALHVPDPRAEIDSLIGATALANNLILVTRNIKDFKDMEGLKLLNPWDKNAVSID